MRVGQIPGIPTSDRGCAGRNCFRRLSRRPAPISPETLAVAVARTGTGHRWAFEEAYVDRLEDPRVFVVAGNKDPKNAGRRHSKDGERPLAGFAPRLATNSRLYPEVRVVHPLRLAALPTTR